MPLAMRFRASISASLQNELVAAKITLHTAACLIFVCFALQPLSRIERGHLLLFKYKAGSHRHVPFTVRTGAAPTPVKIVIRLAKHGFWPNHRQPGSFGVDYFSIRCFGEILSAAT